MKIIPIVMTTDDNYAFQTSVTIHSILENADKKEQYIFYILNNGCLSEESKKYIETIVKQNRVSIVNYLTLDEKHFSNIVLTTHVHVSSYYRLFISELLQDYDKCIFIDGDTIVYSNLAELYDTELDDNYIAAVLDGGIQYRKDLYVNYNEIIGIPSMQQYINAGVLVMNLKKMRLDNLQDKFIEHMNKNYNMMDQDVLNACCYGKIKRLPLQFNVFYDFYNDWGLLDNTQFTENEIKQAQKETKIIHFASMFKPWVNISYKNSDIWWNYVKKFAEHPVYKRLREKAETAYESMQWNYIVDRCMQEKNIVIFGYSKIGKHLYDALKRSGVSGICAFCDNDANKQEERYLNIKVESLKDILKCSEDAIVINTSQRFTEQINKQLLDEGIPSEKILTFYHKNPSYYDRIDKKYFKIEIEEFYYKKYGTTEKYEDEIEELLAKILKENINLGLLLQAAEG